MSNSQVWKCIFFFYTNRPKIFSRLFQTGKWQYFSRLEHVKFLSMLYRTAQEAWSYHLI